MILEVGRMVDQKQRRNPRVGGRAAHRAKRLKPNFTMLAGLKNTLPLCETMDEAQVHRIDAASMHILEDVGVVFRDDIARRLVSKCHLDMYRPPT